MLDDQVRAQAALLELQLRAGRVLVAIGGREGIDYARISDYLPLGRRLLAETEVYERRWPGGHQAQVEAGILVQQLSLYADWQAAAGERDEANELRREADEIARRHLTSERLAEHVRTRAMEAAASGRFQDALIDLENARNEYSAAGRTIEAAQTLAQLANVYEWLGDYDRALATLDAAAGLVAEQMEGGPPSRASVDAALEQQIGGILYRGRNERQGEDAFSLRRLYYELVQGRARVSRFLGRFDLAQTLFEEAKPFVEEFATVGVDFHLAAIAIDTSDLEAAEALLATIAPQFEEGLLRPRKGALRQLQSDLALKRGDAVAALARAGDGLKDQETFPDLDLAWKLEWRRGRALALSGQAQDALSAYRKAAHVVDTVRLAPLGYVLDTTFVADKLPLFNEAIDLAVRLGDGIAAAELIELIKSRSLAAVLSHPPAPRSTDDPDAKRFDELSQQIDGIAFQMYANTATTDQVRQRQDMLRERRDTLERIRVRDPRWRGLTVPPTVDITSVCQHLGATKRSALVLHLDDSRITAVLLSGNGAVVGEKSLDGRVESALRAYAEELTKPEPNYFMADLCEEEGIDLSDLLPTAVTQGLLLEANTLLVVPHGILHLLPWATMTVGGHRLFVTRAVGVLPNRAGLSSDDEDLLRLEKVGLLGDPDYTKLISRYRPLVQGAEMIGDIETLYGSEGLVAPVVRGSAATQQALAQLMPMGGAASVLHVVCHADVDADEPLASGLILTDSTLDGAEILRLGCGFPEVVLSACSTGWRPESAHGLKLAGDDALGLVASFLEAGARSLLVSITKAKEDVARPFMVSWHGRRRGGATPLEALRRTQLEFEARGVPVWAWAGITAYSSV